MALAVLHFLWPEKPESSPKAAPVNPSRSTRSPRRDFNQLHARPLPIRTHPLPAFAPHNPISLLRLAWTLVSEFLLRPSSHATHHVTYYSAATRSVHVTDAEAARFLWECGFFGKGSLSRSEPEWLQKQNSLYDGSVQPAQTANEATNKRREERREVKRERARLERQELEQQLRDEGKLAVLDVDELSQSKVATQLQPIRESTDIARAATPAPFVPSSSHSTIMNQEHLQLIPYEAFFLTYALGAITVLSSPKGSTLSTSDLFRLFRRTSYFPPLPPHSPVPSDDHFIVSYAVYHHFRSLGWVVRPGIKFAADFLLYARGPVFAHAEFAVLVVPDYGNLGAEVSSRSKHDDERSEWWWLHAANRVQTQVRKSLIIAFVRLPPALHLEAGDARADDVAYLLSRYHIRTFIFKRWSANRHREAK